MDLNNITMMKILQDDMKYHSARQNVIAQNIANADTPDYKRREIEKPNFKGMVKSSMVKLETTSPMHLAGMNSTTSYVPHTTDKPVELDMEAFEMMKNNTEFAKASTAYKKMISLMKQSIDGSGSN